MAKRKSANTFEDNLARLEEINNILESGETGLEESLKLFKEGVKISKECINTLKQAELKITELKSEIETTKED